jgi:hypothetical protein
MVRLAQLVLAVALLTGPAHAADLAFTCSGVFKPLDEKVPPRTISNETLFIGLASKTVWGVIGPYNIDELSDKLIKFSIGTRDQGAYSEGSFDRYSGEVKATVYGDLTVSGGYDLTCNPAKPDF